MAVIKANHGRHPTEIMAPGGPTPEGKINVLCPTCGEVYDIPNPEGQEEYQLTADHFPPGEAFLPKGSVISRTEADRLGLGGDGGK